MSSRLEDILHIRKNHSFYDEGLWEFVSQRLGRNLINLTNTNLQARLASIDRNIQFLDNGVTPRDHLHPDQRGWLSPWWWLRARYVTTLEFKHRSITPMPSPVIPAMPMLAEGFTGVVGGGKRLLVRISKIEWLMETLVHGRLRFASAALYRDPALNSARGDDELRKAYRRPGQVVAITTQAGRKIKAIGDVEFASARVAQDGRELVDIPYWLCSFSSDLDPRLFEEFASDQPENDGCLVIFEPHKFVQRALPELTRIARFAKKSLCPVDYFDPYYLDSRDLAVVQSKDFRYAYQREMRFVLDPGIASAISDGNHVFANIGTIEDIAAIYSREGEKLAGTGPSSFLV
ncbi:hypothetical protein PQQ73_10205 [Paraburkholderia strydomiana]|jgi:hypothetical protein|uniref:Wadjet protein JetD C-terminal domain-containing protein n=1 Tax=Paraburkholderia strydomiana TaxID=1245417 RepID=A0ABW9ECB0_9BURK